MTLLRSELDGLETVEWAMRYFDGAQSGRNFRLRTARRLEKAGMIRSIGFAQQCDGDGFIIEGRQEREAWALTSKGRKALAEARKS